MPERMKRLWGEQDAGEVEMGGERMTGRGKHGLRAAAVLLGAMILLSGCAGARESDAVSNAMLAIGDRDFEGAVKTLEAAEKDGEHSRSLFRALGIAEMGMGDYQSAAEYLEKALTKSSGIPDDCDFDINFYLASCYFKLGRNEDARDVYNAILAMRPESVEGHRLRATVDLAEGDADAADADFRKAIELAPTDFDGMIAAYETMKSYGQEEKGQAYLKEALDKSASMSDYDKGRMYYYLGDYDSAKASLEKAGKAENGSYRTTLLLGQTYEALGSHDYAADTYEKYLAGDQTHAEIYNQLGLCRLQLNNPKAALTAFQTGEKITGNTIMQSLRFNEIVAYERLGDFEKAAALIESYLKQYPEDTEAQREAIFLRTR